jgi:DNA polymerase-3 subunit gamma/tau
MAIATIVAHLAKVLTTEQIPFDMSALNLLGRFGRGSMRDALSLTDQAIAYSDGKVAVELVRQMLGTVDRSYIFQLIEALTSGDGRTAIHIIDTLREQGLSPAATLEEMTDILQRMAVFQITGSNSTEDLDDEDAQHTKHLAQIMASDEIQLLYSICLRGRSDLSLATDEYCALTMILLRHLAFAQPNDPSEPSAISPLPAPPTQPKKLSPDNSEKDKFVKKNDESTTEQVNKAVAAPISEALQTVTEDCMALVKSKKNLSEVAILMPVTNDLGDNHELDNFWFNTVHALIEKSAISGLTKEMAMKTQLVEFDGVLCRLRIESTSLNRADCQENLRQALATIGYDITLLIEAGVVQSTPAMRVLNDVNKRQKDAESIILADPWVQTLIRDFGAKVLPSSIKAIS